MLSRRAIALVLLTTALMVGTMIASAADHECKSGDCPFQASCGGDFYDRDGCTISVL